VLRLFAPDTGIHAGRCEKYMYSYPRTVLALQPGGRASQAVCNAAARFEQLAREWGKEKLHKKTAAPPQMMEKQKDASVKLDDGDDLFGDEDEKEGESPLGYRFHLDAKPAIPLNILQTLGSYPGSSD
jgi:hypothetical protein